MRFNLEIGEDEILGCSECGELGHGPQIFYLDVKFAPPVKSNQVHWVTCEACFQRIRKELSMKTEEDD